MYRQKRSRQNNRVNVIQRTTSETLRISESERISDNNFKPTKMSNQQQSHKNNPSGSFQITGVSVTSKADTGDDSADDLDESRTEDISRLDNETPSFSEDTCSRDVDDTRASPITAPHTTSTPSGLTLVPLEEPANIKATGAIPKIIKTTASTVIPVTTTSARMLGDRFMVVKIETPVPFFRGRWKCLDYLDHSIHTPKDGYVYCHDHYVKQSSIKSTYTQAKCTAASNVVEPIKKTPLTTINVPFYWPQQVLAPPIRHQQSLIEPGYRVYPSSEYVYGNAFQDQACALPSTQHYNIPTNTSVPTYMPQQVFHDGTCFSTPSQMYNMVMHSSLSTYMQQPVLQNEARTVPNFQNYNLPMNMSASVYMPQQPVQQQHVQLAAQQPPVYSFQSTASSNSVNIRYQSMSSSLQQPLYNTNIAPNSIANVATSVSNNSFGFPTQNAVATSISYAHVPQSQYSPVCTISNISGNSNTGTIGYNYMQQSSQQPMYILPAVPNSNANFSTSSVESVTQSTSTYIPESQFPSCSTSNANLGPLVTASSAPQVSQSRPIHCTTKEDSASYNSGSIGYNYTPQSLFSTESVYDSSGYISAKLSTTSAGFYTTVSNTSVPESQFSLNSISNIVSSSLPLVRMAAPQMYQSTPIQHTPDANKKDSGIYGTGSIGASYTSQMMQQAQHTVESVSILDTTLATSLSTTSVGLDTQNALGTTVSSTYVPESQYVSCPIRNVKSPSAVSLMALQRPLCTTESVTTSIAPSSLVTAISTSQVFQSTPIQDTATTQEETENPNTRNFEYNYVPQSIQRPLYTIESVSNSDASKASSTTSVGFVTQNRLAASVSNTCEPQFSISKVNVAPQAQLSAIPSSSLLTPATTAQVSQSIPTQFTSTTQEEVLLNVSNIYALDLT